MERYVIMADKDKQQSENGQPKSDENGSVLDMDLEHADKIIRVPSSSLKGRKKYTISEDIMILTHIVTTHQHDNVTGVLLWQTMEQFKVTDHTWESMKCRYLKYILPTIDNYDIPNSWKSLLTGDTSKAISDKNSPKIVLQTNNQSPKKKGNSNFGLFGNHPPQLKKKKSSNVENDTEKTSPKKFSDPDCSAINSSTVTPSPSKSPLTNPTSTPKQKDGCSKFVNIAVNLEEQIDEYDSREMSEDILEPNKSVHASKVGSFLSESEDEFDMNLLKMTVENKSANFDKINQEKSVYVSNVETKYPNSSVEVKNNHVISDNAVTGTNVLSQNEETMQSESCLPTTNVICCEDDFDQNLIEKATEINRPTGTFSKKHISRRKTKSPMVLTTKRQAKGTSLRDFVASEVCDLSTDENDESTLDELEKVVGEFHDKYDLNKDQTISVLWYFSGNVKNAMQWIEFGSELSNLRPWSKGDDSLLTSTTETHLKYLKVKYTAEKIAERNLFFEELKL